MILTILEAPSVRPLADLADLPQVSILRTQEEFTVSAHQTQELFNIRLFSKQLRHSVDVLVFADKSPSACEGSSFWPNFLSVISGTARLRTISWYLQKLPGSMRRTLVLGGPGHQVSTHNLCSPQQLGAVTKCPEPAVGTLHAVGLLWRNLSYCNLKPTLPKGAGKPTRLLGKPWRIHGNPVNSRRCFTNI